MFINPKCEFKFKTWKRYKIMRSRRCGTFRKKNFERTSKNLILLYAIFFEPLFSGFDEIESITKKLY